MTPATDRPRIALTTAPAPGAVAILALFGLGALPLLQRLTGRTDWPLAHLRLADFGAIDQGLAVLLREDWAELMPHGGPRVVQRLLDRLVELGAAYEPDPPALAVYPEAGSELEADMLAALARAASPIAVDLLLAQPALWRAALEVPIDWPALLGRAAVLNRLIEPATVAVVGRPNVGKSTLTNRLLGRSASVVADLPGTTRDWVAGLAELGGVAVRWIDTPGLRQSADAIEQRAIELAAGVVARAEVLVALREPAIGWPEPGDLPRRPDLWVMNKMDAHPSAPAGGDGHAADAPLPISAETGAGIDILQAAVLRALGWTEQLAAAPLWAFSGFLRSGAARDPVAMRRYVG